VVKSFAVSTGAAIVFVSDMCSIYYDKITKKGLVIVKYKTEREVILNLTKA
jgi:hypothetical protein